jgi:pimeloyl-ACP methyl ester carboxylesterase
MAHDHPNFIKKAVLSGPPLLSESQINGLKSSLKPFAITEDGSHLTQVWERIRKRDFALPLETVHREVLLTQSAREAVQGAYQAVFEQPFKVQLEALEIPILVMAGENDTLRASLEPAYQMLRNGEMRVITGEGPYICDQNPQAVTEILKSFFKE